MLGPPDANTSLAQLFEECSDAVFITDPLEDRILDANPAASRLLGYTREEYKVTPISQIHPHELPQMRAFLDGALRDGVNWTIEMACRTKSGTFLPTEITLLGLDSGNRVYVISLVRDRSEHRGSCLTEATFAAFDTEVGRPVRDTDSLT
ncbi:MAG: PAS domain-containing protein [Solirubrobacterales bacterium]|nr:PAS domain-containing protein [Solirubrobacterales bacterium]